MVHQAKELVKPKFCLSNSRDGEEPRVVLRLSYTYCGTCPTFPYAHTKQMEKEISHKPYLPMIPEICTAFRSLMMMCIGMATSEVQLFELTLSKHLYV